MEIIQNGEGTYLFRPVRIISYDHTKTSLLQTYGFLLRSINRRTKRLFTSNSTLNVEYGPIRTILLVLDYLRTLLQQNRHHYTRPLPINYLYFLTSLGLVIEQRPCLVDRARYQLVTASLPAVKLPLYVPCVPLTLRGHSHRTLTVRPLTELRSINTRDILHISLAEH